MKRPFLKVVYDAWYRLMCDDILESAAREADAPIERRLLKSDGSRFEASGSELSEESGI